MEVKGVATLLDRVVQGGQKLKNVSARNANNVWNGKRLMELTPEENEERLRQMRSVRSRRYIENLDEAMKERRRQQIAESKRRFASGLSDNQLAEARNRNSEYSRSYRDNMTPEQRKAYNDRANQLQREARTNESAEQREKRLEISRNRDRKRYAEETPEQRAIRLARNREYKKRIRGKASPAHEDAIQVAENVSAEQPSIQTIETLGGVNRPYVGEGNGVFLANGRGNSIYGRKLMQLGNVVRAARDRVRRRFETFENSTGSGIGDRRLYNESEAAASGLMDEVTAASGLDMEGFREYLDECAKRTGNGQKCYDDFFSGAFRKYAPTASQIAMDPVRYLDHHSRLVRSYAGSIVSGANTYNAPREMKFVEDGDLLKMYQQNDDVDAFNEWFERNVARNGSLARLRAYKKFSGVDKDFANEMSDQGIVDLYMSARDALKNADFTKASPTTYVNRRFDWDLGSRFRTEFGGSAGEQKVPGRRYHEQRMVPSGEHPDGAIENSDERYYYNTARDIANRDSRQKEFESLLYGPVRDAFSGEENGKEVFETLLKSSGEAKAMMDDSSERLGRSRVYINNMIKRARQKLKERGIIGSDN